MRFILTLIAVCFLAPQASAADVFIKKNERREIPKVELPEEAVPAPITIPSPKKKDLTKQYYKNCMQHQGGIMSKESKEMLCLCTTNQINETLSAEQMQVMFTDTAEGAHIRNQVVNHVYVPCMQYPARDLVYHNCASDPGVKKGLKRYKKVCSCLADNMSKFVASHGKQIVANIEAESKNGMGIKDPMNAFLSSKAFQNKSQHYITDCIGRHELSR